MDDAPQRTSQDRICIPIRLSVCSPGRTAPYLEEPGRSNQALAQRPGSSRLVARFAKSPPRGMSRADRGVVRAEVERPPAGRTADTSLARRALDPMRVRRFALSTMQKVL